MTFRRRHVSVESAKSVAPGAGTPGLSTTTVTIYLKKELSMANVAYVSECQIERRQGPFRIARLPGESQPVIFGVHGTVAKHYGIDPAKLQESHSSTIGYVIAATAG